MQPRVRAIIDRPRQRYDLALRRNRAGNWIVTHGGRGEWVSCSRARRRHRMRATSKNFGTHLIAFSRRWQGAAASADWPGRTRWCHIAYKRGIPTCQLCVMVFTRNLGNTNKTTQYARVRQQGPNDQEQLQTTSEKEATFFRNWKPTYLIVWDHPSVPASTWDSATERRTHPAIRSRGTNRYQSDRSQAHTTDITRSGCSVVGYWNVPLTIRSRRIARSRNRLPSLLRRPAWSKILRPSRWQTGKESRPTTGTPTALSLTDCSGLIQLQLFFQSTPVELHAPVPLDLVALHQVHVSSKAVQRAAEVDFPSCWVWVVTIFDKLSAVDGPWLVESCIAGYVVALLLRMHPWHLKDELFSVGPEQTRSFALLDLLVQPRHKSLLPWFHRANSDNLTVPDNQPSRLWPNRCRDDAYMSGGRALQQQVEPVLVSRVDNHMYAISVQRGVAISGEYPRYAWSRELGWVRDPCCFRIADIDKGSNRTSTCAQHNAVRS